MAENKQEKSIVTEETEKKPEGGITLTSEELKDFREMMKKNAENAILVKEQAGIIAQLHDQLKNGARTGDDLNTESQENSVKVGTVCQMRRLPETNEWVLGWTDRGSYRERDEKFNEIVEYVDLVVQGKEKPVKMRYLDFLNECPRRYVRILNRNKVRTDVEKGDLVERAVYDPKMKDMIFTGQKVRSTVTKDVYEYVLDLDGKEVTVSERFINA